MAKEGSLNRIKGRMQIITAGALRLGFDTATNINIRLINMNNTNVSEY